MRCIVRNSQLVGSLAFLEEKDASVLLCAFTVKLYLQLKNNYFFSETEYFWLSFLGFIFFFGG